MLSKTNYVEPVINGQTLFSLKNNIPENTGR